MRRYPFNSRGSMAEFAPAFAIFLIAFFPLLDFLGLAMSIGTAQFMGFQAAQKASVANTPADAVDAMYAELDNQANSNFAKFANITIDGAYVTPPPGVFVYRPGRMGNVTKLYVVRTNIQSQVTEHVASPPPDQFDPNTYIYEYYCVTGFQIDPFINLGGIPGMGMIPGLGQPFKLKFATARAVESTEQFNLNQNPVNRPAWSAVSMAGSAGPTWRQGLP